MHPSDKELIDAYLSAEPWACAKITEFIVAAISGFRRDLGEEYEDQVSEIQIKVLRSLQRGKFKGHSRLRTYIWQIVTHHCLGFFRRRKTLKVGEEILEDLEIPALQVSNVEERQLLNHLRQELSEDCWRILLWVAAGWGAKEIGARLGKPAGSVRTQLFRCRKRAAAIRKRLSRSKDV